MKAQKGVSSTTNTKPRGAILVPAQAYVTVLIIKLLVPYMYSQKMHVRQ